MSLTKVSYSMIDGAPANVLDFGAVGDGVTDDTAAFAAALAASRAVYVPEGTYLVSTVKFPQNGTNLIGQTKTTTILKGTAGATKIVDISGTVSAYIIENALENMTLDMSAMANASTSRGIYMARAYNNTINNVNVINAPASARSLYMECLPGAGAGAGVFTTQVTNCDFGSTTGIIEMNGISTANAITTITYLDTRFGQAIIDSAVSINFIQATVQGDLDKFVLSNTFGVSISGSDIEGTGTYLVLGAGNNHFYSYGNQFVGFTGTYSTGSFDQFGSRSYINDPVKQEVEFLGHDIYVTNGKINVQSDTGIGLRHVSETVGTAVYTDWEFKTANGSVFVGQQTNGDAVLSNYANGSILLSYGGTTKFGWRQSDDKLQIGSSTSPTAGAVAGYINIVISGVSYKIPYHSV